MEPISTNWVEVGKTVRFDFLLHHAAESYKFYPCFMQMGDITWNLLFCSRKMSVTPPLHDAAVRSDSHCTLQPRVKSLHFMMQGGGEISAKKNHLLNSLQYFAAERFNSLL
jgi:hypothetical protein